jgi:hypothetical protein
LLPDGRKNKKPTTVTSRGFLSKFNLPSTSPGGIAAYHDDYQQYLPNLIHHRPKLAYSQKPGQVRNRYNSAKETDSQGVGRRAESVTFIFW